MTLTKARLSALVVLTTAAGYWLHHLRHAWPGDLPWRLIHTLIGTTLTAFGAAVFNQLMEALHIEESGVERLLSRLIALPADRFLRMKRGVSFGVSDASGRPSLIRGQYQSPILVQWRTAERQQRRVEVALHRFL